VDKNVSSPLSCWRYSEKGNVVAEMWVVDGIPSNKLAKREIGIGMLRIHCSTPPE